MLSVILPVKDEPYLPTLLHIFPLILTDYEVKIQTEKGLGYAITQGIKNAKGNVIVICDADGSHDVLAIPRMVSLIGKYDLVIGSRYAGGKTEDSFSRQLVSRFFCLIAQILFNLKIKDSMGGFIVAKKEVFQKYPIETEGFKILLELLVKSRGNLKVAEYPIAFRRRKMGRSKASPWEALRTLRLMLKLKVSFKS